MSKIDECFNPPEGKKKGLFKHEPDLNTAEKHLSKAQWNLLAMRSNYEKHFFDWTIIIGYYAMYHATLAALWLLGIEARRHDCAAEALEHFFVKEGKLDKERTTELEKAKKLEKSLVETLNKAAVQRTQVQYGVVDVKAKDADWILKAATRFVQEVEDLVSESKGIKIHRI